MHVMLVGSLNGLFVICRVKRLTVKTVPLDGTLSAQLPFLQRIHVPSFKTDRIFPR